MSQVSDFQGPATSRGEIFFFIVMGHMGIQKKRNWLTVSTQKKKKLDTTSECREISKKVKTAQISKPNRQLF